MPLPRQAGSLGAGPEPGLGGPAPRRRVPGPGDRLGRRRRRGRARAPRRSAGACGSSPTASTGPTRSSSANGRSPGPTGSSSARSASTPTATRTPIEQLALERLHDGAFKSRGLPDDALDDRDRRDRGRAPRLRRRAGRGAALHPRLRARAKRSSTVAGSCARERWSSPTSAGRSGRLFGGEAGRLRGGHRASPAGADRRRSRSTGCRRSPSTRRCGWPRVIDHRPSLNRSPHASHPDRVI